MRTRPFFFVEPGKGHDGMKSGRQKITAALARSRRLIERRRVMASNVKHVYLLEQQHFQMDKILIVSRSSMPIAYLAMLVIGFQNLIVIFESIDIYIKAVTSWPSA